MSKLDIHKKEKDKNSFSVCLFFKSVFNFLQAFLRKFVLMKVHEKSDLYESSFEVFKKQINQKEKKIRLESIYQKLSSPIGFVH